MRAALPQLIHQARRRARRSIVRLHLSLTRANHEQRLGAERQLRGREQYDQLQSADAVIVSYAKSGRTWLRVMISRLYQQVYDLPKDAVIGFDNFHYIDRRIPRLLFTHDEFIRDYSGNTSTKLDFYDKKVLLMVRDPRDVVVSSFFHWRFRTQPWKKQLSFYPPHGSDLSMFEFVQDDRSGLRRIINFMNSWAEELVNTRAHEIVKYENMRADPVNELARVARFLEIPASAAQITEAVDYASYENMKKKEAEQSFRTSGARLNPGDKSIPDSYKVRRAKVGGYRDYFEDAQIKVIDEIVTENLDSAYGYNQSKTADIKSD
ncbi:sulfotransferase domain-containing protein [Roseovarius sp.]|uniref:sulfotransferase domain-containing protein n=1 Tax=Roseovarius sp. TaxID=1486281 RepID=UPI00261E32B3|nr:sulfotransferase domain-containing protein [Roseovarius sp.]